jgi:ppGpp synthetase/RelA/SpoT-type nucleotidyltranferase
VPLPISKSALDRLGARLATAEDTADEDLQELAGVAGAYQDILDRVKAQLNALDYAPTTRVKTTGTLIEKMHRQAGIRLSQVQDLAGARIIVADRAEQDDATVKIRQHFESQSCTSKVIDRRASPSHGYRAVHLIVLMDGIPVEIQVRTGLQDAWAQIVERLADRWGRGIRYGEEPENPDERVQGDSPGEPTRGSVVATLMRLSDAIDRLENIRETLRSGVSNIERARELLDRAKDAASRSQSWTAELPKDLAPLLREGFESLGEETPQHPLTFEDVESLFQNSADMVRQVLDSQAQELADTEATIRGILQRLAATVDD